MGNRTAVTVKDNKQRLVEQRNYAYNESNQIVTESIKSGYHPDYELIEYINDVNREYTEVLVEKDYRGRTDTSHIYGADRLSFDHRNGYTGYYLYDPRGSVTGITTEWGDIYQSYCYDVFGNITYGTPEYENEYTYNGESYNPNIKSQYLRARYYDVVTARATRVNNFLKDKYSNCIDGLMGLTELWLELGYTTDSPHIIQGKDNSISPVEYYTDANYNYLYEKNKYWLEDEVNYLIQNPEMRK